jgi:hypothetical protein
MLKALESLGFVESFALTRETFALDPTPWGSDRGSDFSLALKCSGT